MVEFITLEGSFSMPRDEDWVLVIVKKSGRAAARGIVERHKDSAVFYTDERRAGNTYERAQDWAEEHYIDTVYIAREH